MKRAYIDVETSGTDERIHGILQVSGIIEVDGKERARFNFPARLYPDDEYDPGSTKAHGLSEEEARSEERPAPDIVYKGIRTLLDKTVNRYDKYDKMFFIAYNATFDDRFLRTFWSKNKDPYYGSYFWWSPIDLASIAGHYLSEKRATLSNFKLQTVAQALDIPIDPDKLHDSMYDVLIMKEIYNKLVIPPSFFPAT